MKRFALVLALVFAATCLIVGVSPAQEKTISLRLSTFFPPTHPLAVITNDWCKEVEKRTNGRVKIKQYGGATLTSPVQTYDSVVQGVVDAGNMVLGYTMGKFPLSEVLDYPLGYPNATVAHKLANAYYAKFKPKEFDDVKVMYFHAQTPGILHTKSRPVAKLEDLKGMKIRTQGTNAKFMQLLGGIPVAMPMGDAYDAINKGVADGIMCADEVLKSWKIGEVVKYTTQNYASAYTSIFLVAMNKNKWASIKPEDQKIIEQINTEWIDRSAKVWEQIDKEGQEFAKKRGIKVTKLSPEEDARWAAKAQPLYDEYVKNMKAKGLPGEEVLKFVRNFLKTNK
jgi:TRAP-type C4-dicarboxylate transport system substrate-binding protein